MLKKREKMKRIIDERTKFFNDVQQRKRELYEDKMGKWEKKFKEEKTKRLAERRKEREKTRREDYERRVLEEETRRVAEEEKRSKVNVSRIASDIQGRNLYFEIFRFFEVLTFETSAERRSVALFKPLEVIMSMGKRVFVALPSMKTQLTNESVVVSIGIRIHRDTS